MCLIQNCLNSPEVNSGSASTLIWSISIKPYASAILNDALYSFMACSILSVRLFGTPYITENLEKASTNIRQCTCNVFRVNPGLLLQGNISINTVALG